MSMRGITPTTRPPALQHGVGDDAHEPELAAAVDQREPGLRQRRAHLFAPRASS